MARIHPLMPGEARASLAQRLAKTVDRARQLVVNMGLRPMRVFLVWERSPGNERGEGLPVEMGRCEILPTPKIKSLDGVTFSVLHAGTIPVGSIALSEISVERYTYDQLSGLMVPGAEHTDQIPEPWSFFYEVVEDGRGDAQPQRQKYRRLSYPTRDSENFQWTVMLERVSEDRGRDGKTAYTTGDE